MPFRRLPVAVSILLALAAAAVAEPPEKPRSRVSREGMEALEAQLGRAVDRVSLPHAARLLGRTEPVRGYRLPGYGVVFVLAPRVLPGGEGQVYVLRRDGPTPRRLRVETRRTGAPEPASEEESEIEALERQVLILQHETEAVRRAAEEEMERIVRDVRVRVETPATVQVEVSPAPADPPAPEAPAPPPAPAPPVPAPPPWKFWFETGTPEETRSPEVVVADVRAAVLDALAAPGARLAGLGADERVTVTVDFVPGGIFVAQARPDTTLVVSARMRDVEDRARGAISREELQRRIEVTEY